MPGPFGIENDVLDRLAEVLGPTWRVASGAALAEAGISLGELVPLAMVQPIETGVSDQSARAHHIIENQIWSVVLTMGHESDAEQLRVDWSEVDVAVVAVIMGLTGWEPPAGVRELRYLDRSAFGLEGGLVEVEMTFTIFYHLTAS